jgi:co-chaperonin GroES (HSP10)
MAKELDLQSLELDESIKAEAVLVRPERDYLLVHVLEETSGIVKSYDTRDTKQRGQVLAVGPGDYRDGVYVENTCKVGDIILWEEAAEANTPAYLKHKDLYLVKEARKIATLIPAPKDEKETK